MKNIFIALIAVVLSTACTVGARRDTLSRECDETCQENIRLRKEIARLQQEKGQQPDAGNATVAQGGQVSTSVMVARQPHGPYNGTIGAQPRQLTQDDKLHFENLVCLPSSWNFTCKDRDRMNGPDYNFYLAFQIDSVNPAAFPATFYVHPDTAEMLMPPNSTAFIPLGESCLVNVTVKAYKDKGGIVNGRKVIKLSPHPWKEKTFQMNACDGEAYQQITHTFFDY